MWQEVEVISLTLQPLRGSRIEVTCPKAKVWMECKPTLPLELQAFSPKVGVAEGAQAVLWEFAIYLSLASFPRNPVGYTFLASVS